jgi:hypothetical protein
MNCSVCNENNWKASEEVPEDMDDITVLYLVCHGCGNIWTAQIEI